MIPKILHFIWFGHKPKYVDYSISFFKEMNPTFEINFIDDSILKIHSNKYYPHQIENIGKYKQVCDYYFKLGRSKQQVLSNILRLMLLNEYGGIYLDCDCFPIRPFDENILLSDFICTRYYEKNFIRRDCFFMGKSLELDNEIFLYSDFPARDILVSDRKDSLDINFLKRKKQFIECKLTPKYSNDKLQYIEHFNIGAWK